LKERASSRKGAERRIAPHAHWENDSLSHPPHWPIAIAG